MTPWLLICGGALLLDVLVGLVVLVVEARHAVPAPDGDQ